MTSLHIREIFTVIRQQNLAFTPAATTAVLAEHFDAQQVFHSCSVEGLTPSTVIDFLLSKGKISEEGGKGCGCKH